MRATRERAAWRDKLDADVFAAGRERYTWGDVVLASVLSGDWAELVEQAREGVASRKRLADAGATLDADAVTAEANEFRYARELLTVAETEAWLERWGLTADQWMAYVEESVLRRRSTAAAERTAAPGDVSADDLAAGVWSTAVCSGALERLARRLAGRAAAAASAEAPPPGAGDPGRVEGVSPFDGVVAEMAALGLASLVDAGRCRARLERLQALERRFDDFRRRVVTPAAVRAAVQAHALDWIRLRCETVSFADEQAAREAACCVREDGDALASVARAAHAPVVERRVYLDETELAERPILLSAERDRLLGPLPEVGAYVLVKVVDKILPSPEDPEIRARAEETVLRAAVEREIASRVRWEVRL